MSKVDSTRIAAIKANFEHSDVITEENLADLIDAIAEAAEDHEHVSGGGSGSGTGDASLVSIIGSGTRWRVGVSLVQGGDYVSGPAYADLWTVGFSKIQRLDQIAS